MARQATPLPLALPPRTAGIPAARWLANAIRREILDGRLRSGTRLPATRELAQQQGLSRGTVVAAFEDLAAQGYLEANVGSGTCVSRVLPDELLTLDGPSTPTRTSTRTEPQKVNPTHPQRLSRFAQRARPFPGFGETASRAFRTDLPALDLFPTALWAQITSRRTRRATASQLRGCGPLGEPTLQVALADYLTHSRGVVCAPEQIVVVSGVQEALDLAARLLIDPGDRVGIEDPGYPGAALVFEAYGAKVVPLALDGEGMAVPSRRQGNLRLVYTTPAHQFPTCVGMSLPRRLALLDWARSTGAMIFEDDYDSEFRYVGRPVPALQGLDRHGVVLFAGSLSKVLFPSLRLGYLVVPLDLVDRVAALQSIHTRHPPVLEQVVLRDFLAEGHFGRHLRRMREIYAERLTVLLEGAREKLSDALELSEIEAGLQTVGWLRAGLEGETIAHAAAARGLEVTPLSRYARRPLAREGLQLGFAAVDAREIRRGVRELASVFAKGR